MSLNKKLLDIRKSVDSISKDGKNTFQHYKFVSSNAVLMSIRKIMNDKELLLIPQIIDFRTIELFAQDSKKNTKHSGIMFKMTYTWLDTESDETLICEWAGLSVDKQDQALGKALTYAEKYFILKFFNIPTDKDDPDSSAPPKDTSDVANYKIQNGKNKGKALHELPTQEIQGLYDWLVKNNPGAFTDKVGFYLDSRITEADQAQDVKKSGI